MEQSVSVTVNRANPDVTWPTILSAVFGQTLSDVSLPGNGTGSPTGTFEWVMPAAPVGGSGARLHNLRFTPNDTANYNTLIQSVNVWVYTINSTGIEMMRVEGGSFMFGRCAQANPTGGTLTEVDSFSIGKYQITQEQWREVMTGNPNGISVNPSSFHGGSGREPAAGEVQERRPVEQVSWYDVLVFCNRLSMAEGLTPAYEMQTEVNPGVWSSDPDTWGQVPLWGDSAIPRWDAVKIVPDSTGYRLPTEHQWEFAAKGGTKSEGYTGTAFDTYFIYSGSNTANDVAWHSGNSDWMTREVGRLAANELGLYDMSGNGWEWCWDLWSISGSIRVIRGGSWDNDAQDLRSAVRYFGWPYNRGSNDGFRLLRP